MKRTFLLVMAALAALALFGGLVHAVLVLAQLSTPAAKTVYGATTGRLWASAAAVLALISFVLGARALRQSWVVRDGSGRRGALGALGLGLVAAINGGLNLGAAQGGPGSGNGVVGAAGALVLGLIAAALGMVALARLRRSAKADLPGEVG